MQSLKFLIFSFMYKFLMYIEFPDMDKTSLPKFLKIYLRIYKIDTNLKIILLGHQNNYMKLVVIIV